MIDDNEVRTLVAAAYADEDILTTLDEVRRRVRGPVRRRAPGMIGVAAIAAVLVAVLVLAWPSPHRPRLTVAAPDSTFADQCVARWDSVRSPTDGPLPPLVVVVGNPPQLRIYQNSGLEVDCVRSPDG